MNLRFKQFCRLYRLDIWFKTFIIMMFFELLRRYLGLDIELVILTYLVFIMFLIGKNE